MSLLQIVLLFVVGYAGYIAFVILSGLIEVEISQERKWQLMLVWPMIPFVVILIIVLLSGLVFLPNPKGES